MILNALKAEFLKMRGSLIWPILIAAPAGLGLLSALAMLSANGTPSWDSIFTSFTLPLWSMFLLPMSIIAFTAFNAQIDHVSGAFEHLLALPLPRWLVFFAKIIISCFAVSLISFLMPVFIWLGVNLGAVIASKQISGQIDLIKIAQLTSFLAVGALPLAVIQIWCGLRFKSFLPAIGLGIIGVLITLAILISGTNKADWFPYAQPFLVIMKPDEAALRAIITLITAIAITPLALTHLSRREQG